MASDEIVRHGAQVRNARELAAIGAVLFGADLVLARSSGSWRGPLFLGFMALSAALIVTGCKRILWLRHKQPAAESGCAGCSR